MRPSTSSSSPAGHGADHRAIQHHWRETRTWLNQHRWELSESVARLYPNVLRVADTVLLTRSAWLPSEPILLDQVHLSWAEEKIDWAIVGDEISTTDVLAADGHGLPFPRYSDAMRQLSAPKIFENRGCYGLRNVDAADAAMTFGSADYFANIDIGEALAHEYAEAVQRKAEPTMADLPFRSLIGDPTDLLLRPVPVAISTLVLRHDRTSSQQQMVLHWRDPHKVASGGGLYQVAPVGVFQPSDDAPWNHRNDFDLWRGIVRELSEELLGASEDYASSDAPIDYDNWHFAQQLNQAGQNRQLSAHWLGAGIDPLTMVCDLLCCVAIDAELFDSVFAALVGDNAEGHLIKSEDATGQTVGVPFTYESVRRFSSTEPMQPAGAALLRQAWRHREVLLA